MDGGTDIDNNAVLFAKGYNSVLDPLYADGTYKKSRRRSSRAGRTRTPLRTSSRP